VPGTLIIGYGNLLRGDDAVGCRVAYKLDQLFQDDPDVEVIASQQLTPEMAEDVARSNFVLFLDAATGEKPGTLRRTRLATAVRAKWFHPPTLSVVFASGRRAALRRRSRSDEHYACGLVLRPQ